MGSGALYLQADYGPTTYLEPSAQATVLQLAVSQNEACDLGSWWYVVDVDVRSSVQLVPLNGTAPQAAAFSRFAAQSPLQLQLEWGVIQSSGGNRRSRVLLDAVPQRFYVCGTSVNVSVVGPPGMEQYSAATGNTLARRGPAGTIFAWVSALVFPVRFAGPQGAELGKVSYRLTIPQGSTAEQVVIPPGARTLTIYDNAATSSPWQWRFDAGGGIGQIPVPNGASSSVQVPNALAVGPSAAANVERTCLLVFGVAP